MPNYKATAPLPIRQDWAPAYLSARAGAYNRDFAFNAPDPQGMPSSNGNRYHGGVDWFAPAGTPVLAPMAGRVIESYRSDDSSGQVFGGTLKVQDSEGRVWVMRHVQPWVGLGTNVSAGQQVAEVHSWTGGGTHLHMEVWRTLGGGYRLENAIDPAVFSFIAGPPSADPKPVADYYFEELPHDQGGNGPVVVWHGKGSTAKAVLLNKLRGRAVSTVRDANGIGYVLWWKKGTYGRKFRFGPWADEGARTATRLVRQESTGRTMRPFKGKNRSLYPYPSKEN
jgi:hypothetical protein